MTFLKRTALSLVAIIAVLIIVAYLLPSKVHVERSVFINAPAETVFRQVNSLKQWSQWSPWYLMEPDATYTYSGPDSGVGATANWKGEVVGEGTQRIESSEPFSAITTSLDFGPQGVASSEWTFSPIDEGTQVIWGFDTDMGMNPISRYFGLMMDRMIGADYEKGLGNLKAICEKSSQTSEEENAPQDAPSGTNPTLESAPDATRSPSTEAEN